MSYILQTHNLTKEIGGKTIISDVNIHVEKGEIYGFLGPNGAGKTTIMKMIMNLWKPTGGRIEIFGRPLTPVSYDVLKRIGSMIEFPVFYDELSGKENLKLHGEYMGYYSPGCVEHVLDMLGLNDAGKNPVKCYSLGMKQRLGIARAIMTKPELLILDEPSNGLDPAGMKQIRDLLKSLCQEYGITILISSHILSEIENVADTIGILNQGKMMKEISMAEIAERNLSYIELRTVSTQKAAYVLSEKLQVRNFKVMDEPEIRIYDEYVSIAKLSKILAGHDVPIEAVSRKTESLEDYFLKMTREGQRNGGERNAEIDPAGI